MSRSGADVRRREQGVIIKRIPKQVEPVDDYCDEIPPDGCQYYGDAELMKRKCLHCDRGECY